MVPPHRKYLTTLQAARHLMVSPVTVRQWAQKGLLASVSTAGGHRRFLPDEIRRFAAAHGMSFDEDERKPLCVVVVDDDLDHAAIMRHLILTAVPTARAETAANGFDAGVMAESLQPSIVVLDINMPGMDGIEVCRRLRAREATAAARIVLVSGCLTPENVTAAREAGADAWLEKSATAKEILQALGLPAASAARRA